MHFWWSSGREVETSRLCLWGTLVRKQSSHKTQANMAASSTRYDEVMADDASKDSKSAKSSKSAHYRTVWKPLLLHDKTSSLLFDQIADFPSVHHHRHQRLLFIYWWILTMAAEVQKSLDTCLIRSGVIAKEQNISTKLKEIKRSTTCSIPSTLVSSGV